MIRPVLPGPLQVTLEAIAAGDTTVQIAARLRLSDNSVKDRLKRLYELLGAENRAHAVAIGFSWGVLSGRTGGPAWLLAADVPLGRLVAARESRRISQRQMAARLGVTRAWLANRESGRYLFPLAVVYRYAELAGVDVGGPPVVVSHAA